MPTRCRISVVDVEADAVPDRLVRCVVMVVRRAAQLAGEPLTAFDVEFHALITEAGGNRALMLAREPIGMLVYPTVEPMMRRLKQAGPRLAKAHRMILNAISDHDEGTAETWMRRHMVDFRRGYELAELDMEKPVDLLHTVSTAP